LNLNSRFKQLKLNSPGRPILRSFSAIPGLWFRSLSIKFRNPGKKVGKAGADCTGEPLEYAFVCV